MYNYIMMSVDFNSSCFRRLYDNSSLWLGLKTERLLSL